MKTKVKKLEIADLEVGMIVGVRYKGEKKKRELIAIKSIDEKEKEIRGRRLEELSSNLLKRTGHPNEDGEHTSYYISYGTHEYEICTLDEEEKKEAHKFLEWSIKHMNTEILYKAEEQAKLVNMKNYVESLKEKVKNS